MSNQMLPKINIRQIIQWVAPVLDTKYLKTKDQYRDVFQILDHLRQLGLLNLDRIDFEGQ